MGYEFYHLPLPNVQWWETSTVEEQIKVSNDMNHCVWF